LSVNRAAATEKIKRAVIAVDAEIGTSRAITMVKVDYEIRASRGRRQFRGEIDG
jgi:hypothetical protein